MTREQSKSRIEQAKKVNLVEYLRSAGYDISETAGYYRCLSPLRSESNPSLDISRKTLKWKDRGSGKSGDLIDLVRELHHCTLNEAVDLILGNKANFEHPELKPVERDKPNIEILEVLSLCDPKLMDYITQRQISPLVAQNWLKEARIRFPYGKHPERIHTVLAWRNDSGGYEFRNSFLKISNAPKNFTSIIKDTFDINLFEGWPDALTCLTIKKGTNFFCTTYVLNSASFFEQLVPFLIGHKINYFGHSDPTGDKILARIKEEKIQVVDYRYLYKGYKDYNDYAVGRVKKRKILKEIFGK